MKKYASSSGKKSGVQSFEIGDDFIVIQFPLNKYKYSFSSCGSEEVEILKELALDGEGLSTYISQNQPHFEWKR